MSFFSKIPTAFWAVLAFILALSGAYWLGSHNKQVEWDTDNKIKAEHVKDVKQAQSDVSDEVKTQVINSIRQVLVEGETKIKQVPVYVPIQADSQCVITNGFVSLWNATNRGESLPDTPDRTYGEASGVKESDVAAQHVQEANYTKQLEIQLNGLIDWVEKQQEVTK